MSRMAQEFQRMVDALRRKAPPASREQERAKRRRTRAQVVADARVAVFALDARCICGSCPPADTDEMHEVVPRSKLRGRPPEEIFNTRNCDRLSRRCHQLVTGTLGKGQALRIAFLDRARGAMGRTELVWKDGRRVVHERTGRGQAWTR